MCKQHLNTFALTARSFECFGLGERPGNVTGLLVDAARNSAKPCLRTALWLERAAAAIACSRPLRGGIGRRDELGCHVAGCPKCCVIKGGEILLGGAAYRLCIKLFPPWPGR